MKLYKWKATYKNIKLFGIIFADNIDNAFMLINQRLCDNGYEQENLVSMACNEINMKPKDSNFYIIYRKKRKRRKEK